MPFTLIKGTFHVCNFSPDRDSIRFKPDNPGLIFGLPGRLPKFNARTHVSARRNRRGIYRIDKTNQGFDASSLGSLTDDYAILPKLFRRLLEHMFNYGIVAGFKKKLEQAKEGVLGLRHCY